MSPSRITESSVVVTPLKHGVDKQYKFGATITWLDLNDISEEDLEALKAATHKYRLVMIKDQHNLDPVKHWELVSRLDPKAPQVHGHGTVKEFHTGGMISASPSHLYLSTFKLLTHLRKEPSRAYPQLLMWESLERLSRRWPLWN